MDRTAYAMAGDLAGGGSGGIEFSRSGIELRVLEGTLRIGFAGGDFVAASDGVTVPWPGSLVVTAGDRLNIAPGGGGNYGYLRFAGNVDVPAVFGSISTNSRARIGGIGGMSLRAGDEFTVAGSGSAPSQVPNPSLDEGPVRFIWGIHADRFSAQVRNRFVGERLVVSERLDRMGVLLNDPGGIFAGERLLSLVSEAVVPGDIQILGDGTPIVLMRDHQPTGGYPRIGTIITYDLDRFAQLRPGTPVAFRPVTVEHAHQLLRSRTR